MPINYKYKTIFVHIPKTAGTSIYSAIELPYEYNARALMTMGKVTPCHHHLTPIQIKNLILPEVWNTFYKFTIVRNPYDRIVSDYRFLQPLIGNQYDIKTFDKFIQLVERIVTTKAYTENHYFDHFRPQSHYFKGVKYDYIGRFENLDDHIKEISRAIGAKGALPWINKSRSKDDDYRKYFNEHTTAIVARLYASDLEMFGYVF
jgi:chondroitin 4-sulfotransferase 11